MSVIPEPKPLGRQTDKQTHIRTHMKNKSVKAHLWRDNSLTRKIASHLLPHQICIAFILQVVHHRNWAHDNRRNSCLRFPDINRKKFSTRVVRKSSQKAELCKTLANSTNINMKELICEHTKLWVSNFLNNGYASRNNRLVALLWESLQYSAAAVIRLMRRPPFGETVRDNRIKAKLANFLRRIQ